MMKAWLADLSATAIWCIADLTKNSLDDLLQ